MPHRPYLRHAARLLLAALACLAVLGGLVPTASARTDATRCAPIRGAVASGRLLVRFRAGTPAARRSTTLRAARGLRTRQLGRSRDLVVTLAKGADLRSALCRLARDPRVAWAAPDRLARIASTAAPNDPYYSSLWGMPRISAPAAWGVTTGSPAVIVGIVDTGMNTTVADLAPNLWTNAGESGTDALGRQKATNGVDDDADGYVDDVHGWSFVSGTGAVTDDHGHGTHVGGTIGARGDDGVGVAGVAWQTTLLPVKALNSAGSGYDSWIASSLAFAAAHGARVVSASLGGQYYSQAQADVMNAYPNTLFVVAAGNSGMDATSFTPCNIRVPNQICVAATDQNDALASFSNYSATGVDLAAPGVGITSWWNGSLGSASGTSMATPHVSGAAALLFAKVPGATAAQVKNALLAGVDPLPGLAGKVATAGRLDVAKALDLLAAPVPPEALDIATSDVHETTATATATLDTHGLAGNVRLEYGTTTTYGTTTATTPLTASDGPRAIPLALASLAPDTTYHLRAVVDTAGGTARGEDTTVTTPAWPVPEALDITTSDVHETTATATATLDTHGLAGNVRLEYGTTTTYGTTTATTPLTASDGPRAIPLALASLAPDTTYHLRAVVDTAGGTARGEDTTVTTPAWPVPEALDITPSDVHETTATATATLDTHGLAGNVRLEYGTTAAYGSTTATTPLTASDGPRAIPLGLASLAPDTTYHLRAVVETTGGTARGEDTTVTTPAWPAPTPTTGAADRIARQSARVAGTVASRLPAIAWFEFGPTDAYGAATDGVAVAAGETATAVSATLDGLAPGTTYHYRLVARNTTGMDVGADATFATGELGPPVPVTGAASVRSASQARLAGTVASPLDAVAWFEYGTTTAYGARSDAAAVAGTGAEEPVATDVTGLAPDATYHFRLVAETDRGRVVGADATFATPPVAPLIGTVTVTAGATAVDVATRVTSGTRAARARVEYGPTPAYGSVSGLVEIPASGAATPVSWRLAGLEPGRAYHLRVVAQGAGGSAVTDDRVVETPAAPAPAPIAEARATARITARTAVVRVRVATDGVPATWWIAYGADGAATRRTAARPLAADADDVVAVQLAGLAPATRIAWRVVIRSRTGETTSPDAGFTTRAARADARAPLATVALPACGGRPPARCAAYRRTSAAWQALRSTATDRGVGASGVAGVEASIVRVAATGCAAFDGVAWLPLACGAAEGVWTPITASSGRHVLPLPDLPPGSYRVRVRATDRAGNVQTLLRAGTSSIGVRITG